MELMRGHVARALVEDKVLKEEWAKFGKTPDCCSAEQATLANATSKRRVLRTFLRVERRIGKGPAKQQKKAKPEKVSL